MKTREIILWVVCALLIVALYFSIMLQKWGLTLLGEEVDYNRFGNWSDAISGIGTTTAIIVALIGIWIQYSATKTAEITKAVEEETAVFFWLESHEVFENNKFVGRTWELLIQNSTKLPIYSWAVIFESYNEHLCNFQKRPLLPNENIFNLPFLDNIEPSKTPLAFLHFEGKSKRCWSRDIKGEPKEISKTEMNCGHTS
jgi:hypothetical protein